MKRTVVALFADTHAGSNKALMQRFDIRTKEVWM
jgi:hypothetical protein